MCECNIYNLKGYFKIDSFTEYSLACVSQIVFQDVFLLCWGKTSWTHSEADVFTGVCRTETFSEQYVSLGPINFYDSCEIKANFHQTFVFILA